MSTLAAPKRLLVVAILLSSLNSPLASAETVTLVLEPEGGASQTTSVSTQIAPPQADYTVQPSVGSQTSTIDINIICNFFGAAIPNCDITLNPLVVAEPNTGGHSHSDAGRPLGQVDPMQGNTGSNAYLTVTYTAPEPAGVVRISGSGYHPLYGFFSGAFTIGIMVAGLQELTASGDYDLVGQTTTHPQNHYATGGMLGSLRTLAHAYTTTYPGQRLAYNDISPPFGGLFDINANWGTPHISHRFGTDVDLRLVPANQRQTLQQMIYQSGISLILVEGNHWHLRQ